MKMHALLLAVLILLSAPAPAGTMEEQTPPFMLAVLRRDGIAVPFAAFSGRRWSSRWPDRVPLEIPISLDSLPDRWWGVEPPPRRLRLWKDGAAAGDVTLTAPVITTLMCEARLAVRTDYKAAGPVPPRFVLPYPKDGLLVSGEVPVAKVEAVSRGSAAWNKVLLLATDEFNKQENSAAGAFTGWRHPVSSSRRKLLPISIEALYHAPTDNPEWTAYFMEAVRTYPAGPDDTDGCGLTTAVSGWVIVGPKDRARVRLSARVTYCDRKGVGYMLPLGLMHASGKTYWVFQFSGFEYETYEVVRPTSRGVESEVVYSAGFCGR